MNGIGYSIGHSGRLLIVGTAATVMDDLEAFRPFAIMPHEIMIVNEAFRFMGYWDYWASLHPEKMAHWRREARRSGRNLDLSSTFLPDLDPDDWEAVTRKGDGVDFPHQRHPWRVDGLTGDDASGSSGLFAARIAIRLGYDKTILAGVPMTATAHHGKLEPWMDADKFITAWSAVEPELQGRVRSMSGRTRDYLGAPTSQWWGH